MKRFILTFAIIALITSCKTQQFTMPNAQCTIIRDTVMQHDSIYVHEFVQGDTVYVTKYRDRWRDKVVNRTDTVYVQPTIPPDKPIPRFYRNCTWGFFILLLLMIGRTAFKLIKLIYLRR